MKTICATNAVHDRSDRSAISVRLKTQENTQIIEELTSNVPRHVNIVGLLNLGGEGGGGGQSPRCPPPPPPPRSAPVSTCISAVANRGTVSCGYNRTRYAKYTHEYLMSRPEGGGYVPPVPPPPPPPGSATDRVLAKLTVCVAVIYRYGWSPDLRIYRHARLSRV